MTIDIKSRDFLAVGDETYPIRKANIWAYDYVGQSHSFLAIATVDCSIKRNPTKDADGFVGQPQNHLTGLKCAPLDPVSADMARTQGLNAQVELLQTFIADDDSYVQLFVEDSKRV
jgi:hypothetical protein